MVKSTTEELDIAQFGRVLHNRPKEMNMTGKSEQEIQEMPDWPPHASALHFSEGHQSYGSTGQLFVVKNGQWERVRPATVTNGDR
jgi:hypothetical protein